MLRMNKTHLNAVLRILASKAKPSVDLFNSIMNWSTVFKL